jgi:hypothetical protein
VPGESVYSEKSGEVRESQFSGTIGVGVTKQIAEFYANSGTIGMLTIEGVGRTGTSYKQAFRVLVTGNTASNAKTLTSLGNVGNSFLASGDFTVSASGNQVKLSYKNNESADVHMNVRVEFVSGY